MKMLHALLQLQASQHCIVLVFDISRKSTHTTKLIFVLKYLALIEDRGPTDRVDLDLQSQKNYSHDPHTCKRSRSKVTRFKI